MIEATQKLHKESSDCIAYENQKIVQLQLHGSLQYTMTLLIQYPSTHWSLTFYSLFGFLFTINLLLH